MTALAMASAQHPGTTIGRNPFSLFLADAGDPQPGPDPRARRGRRHERHGNPPQRMGTGIR
jgi:hypothetical protein